MRTSYQADAFEDERADGQERREPLHLREPDRQYRDRE
jgi:hypothetical protein